MNELEAVIPEEYMGRLLPMSCVFDKWCVWSAVRFLCEVVGVPSACLIHVPLYVPPAGVERAPYGPAGDDCPMPILGSGDWTGPKYGIPVACTLRHALKSVVGDLSHA